MNTKTKTKKAAGKKQAAKTDSSKPKAEANGGPAQQKAAELTTAAANDTTPQQHDDSNGIVVFALRLKRSERDLVHRVAGSGKASQFVRSLTLAAAQGDMQAVQGIVEAVHNTRQ